MSTPLAGWYPNPDGSSDLRYWDGTAWTDRTQPGPSVPATPATPAADPGAGDPRQTPTAEAATTEVAPEVQPPTDTPQDPGAPTQDTVQIAPEPAAPELAITDTVLFGSPPLTPPAPSAPAAPQPAPTNLPPPVAQTPVPPMAPAPAAPAAPPPAAGFTPPTPYPAAPPAYPAAYPAAPPVYGTPAVMAARPTGGNGVGVAALVFGLASIPVAFLCGFLGLALAIAAVTLGIIGLVQAGKTDPPGPRGLSIAGLALAGVGILIMIFWVLILVTG